MISGITKLEDGTIILTVTIPWERVKKIKNDVTEELLKGIQVPGFRKGKAPKKLAQDKLDQTKVKEEILRKLLPQTYSEAISEHKVNPIITPQIHVHKLEDNKDWQFEAITCEAPHIDLDSYKDNIKKITAKSKIVIPGKESQKANFEDISKELLNSVKVNVPKVIIDRETDRLLSQTLDEVKRLGLTLDQYLASTGKTAQNLRSEYEKKAENDIKLELALQKVAETENIKVEDKEIEKAINEAKTEEERKSLEANRYLLASILRQRKTLDFLKSL